MKLSKTHDMFENMMAKLATLNGCNNATLNIIDDCKIKLDEDTQYALRNSPTAGTLCKLLINKDADGDDPNVLVQKNIAIIYVPVSTVERVHRKCRYRPWDRKFCIKFILLHELGHVKDFDRYVGEYIVVAKHHINKICEEFEIGRRNYTDGHNQVCTIDSWLKINELTVEAKANALVGITTKDLKKFFNIMMKNKRI